MTQVEEFIGNMKNEYGMTDKNVLQAIQEDSQHDFVMETQHVDVETASQIIQDTESYLMTTFENPFL